MAFNMHVGEAWPRFWRAAEDSVGVLGPVEADAGAVERLGIAQGEPAVCEGDILVGVREGRRNAPIAARRI